MIKIYRKYKTLKIVTMLTLSILMLVFMAVYPLVKNASAVEDVNVNYLDMSVFETDNLQLKTNHVNVLGVNEYNFAYSFATGQTNLVGIESGYFYLPAGQYTLSAIYQTTYESDVFDCWLVQEDDTETLCELAWHDGEQNILRSETFTAPINGFYYLRISQVVSLVDSGTYLTSFSEIMINEGVEALPFVPYVGEIDEVIPAIENQTNSIIAWLDGAFKVDSGIIAGASLGTFLLVALLVIILAPRRR